ncbi:toxin-antitoxin system YwqK family antitoxin [Belliella kenyensis]|uniref:Toxin-antitoxin system YwqK family antitoxin n=1 Tax=Belliella kenyensis TaxID=1472724 RepID=A0ABV8EN74_9BACT|nr:hypothetical protein [Belliella kenyensis]MCH7403880.1 hypothetical protein [Belliella kenyensis]MDN3604890.1 hypothetical protein [Belliella kenyensis]
MERSRKRKIKIVDYIKGILIGMLYIFLNSCSGNEEVSQYESNLGDLVIHYNGDSTKVVSFGFVNEKGQNGEWFFLDDSQKIEKIQTFKNGILDGPVTEFLCCQKFSTYTYENGLLEGEITYYSSKGYISSKGYFKNGKLDGVWVDFYDGILLSVSKYSQDEKEELYQNDQLQDVIIGDEFFGCCDTHGDF